MADQLHVRTHWWHRGHCVNTSTLSSAGPIYVALDITQNPWWNGSIDGHQGGNACHQGRGALAQVQSHENLAKSYSEHRSPSEIGFTTGVSLWIPNGSPKTRLGIPYAIAVYHSSQPHPSWFELCYPRTFRWQTGLDNAKMFICCLIHCWNIATRCSYTARTEDIGCWSAYFFSEVRFWKIATIKLF